MHRDTLFTIIVYPEMYRDTIFMIEIYPDLYHDTVSLSVSSRFSCVLCFCGCTRASLVLCGLSNTRVSPDGSSQGSLSKVFNVDTSQSESILCHEWYSVLLEVRSSLCWCRPGGNLALFLVVDQVGNLEFSLCVYGPLSWCEDE